MLIRVMCLDADFRKDLHNFAFLGKSARIGTASDWVWYNVPHGPQKQVESFFQGQRCIQTGKEEVISMQRWSDTLGGLFKHIAMGLQAFHYSVYLHPGI